MLTTVITPIAVAAIVVLAMSHRPDAVQQVVAAMVLSALFIIAFRTELTHTSGFTVATQPVMLAMVLNTPWQWAPLMATVGGFIATHDEEDEHTQKNTRWRLVRCGHGFNVLALALVVGHFGMTWSSWSWPLIGLAYAAQVAVDAGIGLMRAHIQDFPLREVFASMRWTYLMDALLGIVGLGLIGLSKGTVPGLLLLGVPILLLWLLSRDRQERYAAEETLKSAYTEVEAQARIDALTGLSNRRVWDEELAAITGEDGAPDPDLVVTVLLADLDHLKVANDTFGHELGDSLLTDFADVLRTCAPRGSTVARLGGDEFGMLVVQTAGSTPPDLVGRVRQGVALRAAARGTDLVTLSASLGQASAPPYPTVDDAVQRADHASRVDKFERRVQRSDTPLDA